MAGGGVGLTAQQRALAQTVRQEWVGHGLTLEPADRAAAEAGVGLVYRAAGLPPPRRVVWAGSPLAGVVAALALTAGSDPGLRVAPHVWGQVWARLAAEAGMPAGDPVWAHLGDEQVGGPVWSLLREPVWDAWWAAWARVGEPVWEEAAAQAAAVDAQVGVVGEAIWQQVIGQVGAGAGRGSAGRSGRRRAATSGSPTRPGSGSGTPRSGRGCWQRSPGAPGCRPGSKSACRLLTAARPGNRCGRRSPWTRRTMRPRAGSPGSSGT